MLKRNLTKEEKNFKCLVDTSSFGSSRFMEIIEQFSKVSILDVTLIEVDSIKSRISNNSELSNGANTSYNVRKFAQKTALDKENKVFSVINTEKIEDDGSTYVDNKIINFLKKHSGYCLLTSDYILACRLKGYNIPYFLPVEFEPDEDSKNDVNTKICTLNKKQLWRNLDGTISIKVSTDSSKPSSTLIFHKDGYFKQGSNVILELGDQVYIIKKENNNENEVSRIKICKYEIIDERAIDENALFVWCNYYTNPNEIQNSDLPEEVKHEAIEKMASNNNS